MIIFNQRQYSIDIMNYADSYIQRLKQGMYKSSALIDTNYAREVVNDLQSFAALIRMECLNDMTLLHDDMNYAKNMKDSYENFGEYCYDMLKQAWTATNECLAQCNQLFYIIKDELSLQNTDVSVASNYIAFNLFGNNNTLELHNFRRMTGLGICYDIRMRQQTIATSSIQEQMQSKFSNFIELGDVLRSLNNGSTLYQAIDTWSAIVNDKLQDSKTNATAAWNATYNAYKQTWFNVELFKQNASIYCNITLTNKKIYEVINRRGQHKKFDYGLDFQKVLQLDYINNANFDFHENQ